MKTPKFKVGDRVRRNSKSLRTFEMNGDTGTIAKIAPDNDLCLITWDDPRANHGFPRRSEYVKHLEPIEAPSPKHTTYAPDGVMISMELEWEIARLLGMVQAFNADHPAIMGQCEKINQMWMGK